MMTIDDARRTLLHGGSLRDLMEAIGVAATEQEGTVSDLLLGLTHAECVAEQAALSLYRRTGRPLPPVGTGLCTDAANWRAWLADSPADSSRMLALALGSEPDRFAAISRGLVQTRLMHGFTKTDRLIITLYYYERLSVAEIAEALGMSETGVVQRHLEIIEKLKSRLAGFQGSRSGERATA